MKHRTLRYAAGWEWHMLNIERTDQASWPRREHGRAQQPGRVQQDNVQEVIAGFKARFPACAEWLAAFPGREDNHIAVSETAGGEALLHGTLLFQATEDPKDIQTLHYWLTPSMLVTAQTDLRLMIRLQQAPWSDKLERCGNAAEAFSVIVCAVLDTFHAGLERLEKELGSLQPRLERMRRSADRAASLLEFRYELLRLGHRFLPLREIESAVKEAFLDALTGMDGYIRLTYKAERVEQLLKRYGEELGTLTAMHESFALTRRDDKWRPVAMVVAGLTPAVTAASIIGFNYKLAGWLLHPLMLTFVCAVVILFTLAILFWLWRGTAVSRDLARLGAAPAAGHGYAEIAAQSAPFGRATAPESEPRPGDHQSLPRRPRRRQTSR